MRFKAPTRAAALAPLKNLIARMECWWFDAARGVETSPVAMLDRLTVVGPATQCFDYLPSRAGTARLALRRLPITAHREYTFIDVGSGKGKVLFVAAEFPFRKIQGIEFAVELHRQAEENISRYFSRKRKCPPIESVNANAIDYQFPRENLVLYFFNPFGAEVMKKVLINLEQSLRECPRDIFLMLAWPELAPVVQARPQWRAIEENPRYCFYRGSGAA
jgi:hypothetical protein